MLRCRLADLAGEVRRHGIRRTAIIVVGRVLGDASRAGFDDSHLELGEGRDRDASATMSKPGRGAERAGRTISVVGIGSGNPEHLTVQAIAELNAADVVFMMDKGETGHELLDVRREICDRYITGPSRIVTAP